MIHCRNALKVSRVEDVQKERGSLIWVGGALPDLVWQWVLHRNSLDVCFITCIDLQTMNTSVSNAHAQADFGNFMVEQNHRPLGTLSHNVTGRKARDSKCLCLCTPKAVICGTTVTSTQQDQQVYLCVTC